MKRSVLFIPVLVLLLAAGVAGAVALAGDEAKPSRYDNPGGHSQVREAQLLVGSQGRRRIVSAASFCGSPVGDPPAFRCEGVAVRAPRGQELPVQPGKAMSLRFGTAVQRVSVRYERATKRGKVIALTYAVPLPASSDGGIRWKTVIPRSSTIERAGTIAVFSVTYRAGARLHMGDSRSKPITSASADFAVPLRVHD